MCHKYNDHGPDVSRLSYVITIRSFSHLWLITEFATRGTKRVLHVEQQLFTIPEQLCSLPDFSGIRVARSFVFCVMFCRSLFVLLFFFLWQLCCRSFLDLRLLITSLVSSCFFLYCASESPIYSRTSSNLCTQLSK